MKTTCHRRNESWVEWFTAFLDVTTRFGWLMYAPPRA